MPIYEYRCQRCGCKFEKLVRGTVNVVEVKCPDCGQTDVERLVSVFGVGGSSTLPASNNGGCAPVGGG
ncbi:MAG: FmdB family zinc ribbon protein [Chloroflexota bacterium]